MYIESSCAVYALTGCLFIAFYRDLTFNELTRLEESSFMGLSLLGRLFIGNNQISNIVDGAFHGLSNLNTL